MRRFHFVDLLRGFAALAVLVCHYRFFLSPSPDGDGRGVLLPYADLLWPLYKHGGQAVMLFWVLSGFVFWTAYGERRVGASEFWRHRFARLYPLHFLTLCLVAVLQFISLRTTGSWIAYGNNDLAHFGAQLFMASNWFTQTTSFNGPIWSVSVEILVYFMFLAFLRQRSAGLALAIAAVAFVAEGLTHQPIALCASLFFFGVVIGKLAPRFPRLVLPAGAAGLALTAAEIAYFGPGTERVLVYLGSVSLLMIFIGLDYRFELPRQFHWFGQSSYSIYLLQIPLLILLLLTVGVIPLPAYVALSIALSALSWRYFEAPVRRYLRSLGPDRSSPEGSLAELASK